ncbi:MAG TPA: mycothiol synthase, partial [Pseudonocardiaceae bacterium]|nr:mycothiol synthase [Pseudonocardiaceae bacterium]
LAGPAPGLCPRSAVDLGMTLTLAWMTRLTDGQVADARALLVAVDAADGFHAISEAAMLRLRPDASSGTWVHLLAHNADGTLVGYAALDERAERRTAEFAAHPEHRRRGVGGAMLAALLERAGGPLWLWAHGEHPAALRLAQRAGLVSRRALYQLRRSLADPLPARPVPEGVTLRTFVPGADEAAVVRVNKRAFAWHPEQSRLDTRELALLETQPWFDPKGFLLAVDPGDRLLGFHWTKMHPDGLGEVYVLAVDPDAQGSGLGGALTVAGLASLRERGAPEAMLYVDADNAAALATYRKLGFTHHHTDVEFLLDPG